jgi:hypothetical protein
VDYGLKQKSTPISPPKNSFGGLVHLVNRGISQQFVMGLVSLSKQSPGILAFKENIMPQSFNRLSYAQIVPAALQNTLLQLSMAESERCWFIGDTANRLKYTAIVDGASVLLSEVYAAVGYYCRKSSRTVRYYARVARFFPPDVCHEHTELGEEDGERIITGSSLYVYCLDCSKDVSDESVGRHKGHHMRLQCSYDDQPSHSLREHYAEVLSFAHFAVAVKSSNQTQWRDVLEFGMAGGWHGNPVSVDMVGQQFSGKLATLPVAWSHSKEPAPHIFGDREILPGGVERVAPGAGIVSALHNLTVGVFRLLDDPGIPPPSREKLSQAIELVKAAIREITSGGLLA